MKNLCAYLVLSLVPKPRVIVIGAGLAGLSAANYLVFDGSKENDSRNISSVKVSYLASAKFHKNNFRSAVEWITKKLLLLCTELQDNLAECCCWGAKPS